MSSEERVLLFKSATNDTYAQALLTVFALPFGARFQLTTYSAKWVPPEIFLQPEQLDGKRALLVCVDTIKDPESIRGAYPLRELKIIRSRQLGDQLELVVETQGFVSCPDYPAYLVELKKVQSILPPQEHSFIAYDRLRSLRVVPSEDMQESLRTWQNATRTLASLVTLEKAAFFWACAIKDEKGRETVQPKVVTPDHGDATSCVWPLQENTAYRMELASALPRHTEEGHPSYLPLHLQYPKCVDGSDTLEIRGPSQRYQIDFFARQAPREPYSNRMSIEPRDTAFKKAPSVSLYVKLTKASRRTRVSAFIRERWVGLMLTGGFGLAYLYGQLVISNKAYPTLGQFLSFPAEVMGAVVTTIALLLLTYIVAQTMGAKNES